MKKVMMTLAIVAAMFAAASCCCNNSKKTEKAATECCADCDKKDGCCETKCDAAKCAECDKAATCDKAAGCDKEGECCKQIIYLKRALQSEGTSATLTISIPEVPPVLASSSGIPSKLLNAETYILRKPSLAASMIRRSV